MTVVRMARRSFVTAALALPTSLTVGKRYGSLMAQSAPAHGDTAAAVARLQARARDLLGSSARAAAPGAGAPRGNTYDELMPELVDLLGTVRTGRARAPSYAQEPLGDLMSESEALLRAIHQAERSPREEETRAAAPTQRPVFDDLKAEYTRLFETCTPLEPRADKIAWHVRRLIAHKSEYEQVGERTKVPWFFIGAAHALEAGFNFASHLHNGDPLTARTVQVPKGRPATWSPPNDWPSSAVDAIQHEGFANQADWSLARLLFRWEAYNGFGNRRRGVNSPYLWSFSNHYSKGKFVQDGVWDPDKVSAQCGAAVMLKALLAGGHVALP